MKYMKKMLAALAVCFCLSLTAVPAMEASAASVQAETAAVQEAQTEGQAAAAASGETSEDEDAAVFMIIMLGGGLLVILVAVISAVSTVASAVSVAANMDVDGE